MERTREGKEKKQVEQVQMDYLTQTRLAGRSRGLSEVAGTSGVVDVVAAAAAAAGGTIAAAVDAATPLVVGRAGVVPVVPVTLVVGRAGAEPVVVPANLAVDATIQLVVEPIEPAWPLVEPVVAKD